MSPEEVHVLIEEYRDGTITPGDARRLADAIRGDREVAARVRRELEFSGHLGQAIDGDDEAGFVRSFAERQRAERGGAEFVSAFEKRIRSTARARRAEPVASSPVPFLIAAGILVSILGAFLARGGKQAAVIVEKRVEEPSADLPKEAPTPEPVPVPEAPPVPKAEAPEPSSPVPSPAPVRTDEPRALPSPAPGPKPSTPEPTRVIRATPVATIDRIEGDVRIDGKPAAAGAELTAETSLSTGAPKSRVSLLLSDGTRLGLEADTALGPILKGPKGTRIPLTQGTLSADVAKQPADQPLTIATPHGEARVMGTVLRLVVDQASTRLEVKEGKVRLTREAKSVDLAAGQYATAGAGSPLLARSLAPDEIVLHATQAKVTGAEWTLVRDPRSLTGVVLEAGQTPFKVVDHVEIRPSYATFTFFAPADKEYRIWLRSTSLEKGDPWTRDMVTLEPTRAVLSQKSPFFGALPTTAYVFTGVAATPGYTWMNGHGEEAKAEAAPLTVKFAETGWQNLRIYVGHPWVRVDTIWLSVTQKTRPSAKQAPPPLTEK
ncbi:MAG TPA: FecR family protein [Planctomycetota bacterium]|nr:FecR family protein [Planctomycetota bacterium]